MENALRALKFSREQGVKLAEAWALDVIASLHGTAGEFEQAVEAHQESVKIFEGLNEIQGQIRALNNLAYTLHLMKNDDEALEYAKRSLELARQWSLTNETYNLYCTLAQILIDLGELEQAEACLQEATHQWTVFGEANVTQVYVLLEWGRLYQLKQETPTAEIYFRKALTLAQTLNQPNEQALCHLKLSELQEKQHRYKRALVEHKAYHSLAESVTGEQTKRRLAAFQITYQVEAARHSAEIYRLQTLQLQQEVEEHKNIQDALEHLTRVDGLTGIANRRYFDEKLIQEYARLARLAGNLSLIMLDVDHFKAFNDLYGHIRGDACLKQIAEVLKKALVRPADLAARYGGEEFACILPNTDAFGAQKVAEKIRQAIYDLALPHQGSSAASYVTVSLGVSTTRCIPGGAATELLLGADRQLYQAKAAGRNQVQAVTLANSELLEPVEGSLLRLIWKAEFCSGHSLIDAQHQELFGIANQLFDVVLSTDAPGEIFPVIARLLEVLEQHFQDEEGVLEECGYPEIREHKSEHARLLAEGQALAAEFKAGDSPVGKVFHYLTFEMIAQHMFIADKKFFPLIGTITT
jgi:diguanylate cyclase (GGDEF)-like protein/hemerythrin-like metal-binding protein